MTVFLVSSFLFGDYNKKVMIRETVLELSPPQWANPAANVATTVPSYGTNGRDSHSASSSSANAAMTFDPPSWIMHERSTRSPQGRGGSEVKGLNDKNGGKGGSLRRKREF